jgi:ABC-type multidrug transport system ATPase subunit
LHNYIFGDESQLEFFRDETELTDEDQDTRNERNSVYNMKREDYWMYPLIAKDIRKVYPGVNGRPPKVANSNICLKVENGELFGLLGPNGAGKTTLITQLTGLFPPTKGNAWVGGYDIKHNLEMVQLMIGVCPQFDILWENLTVEEHLLFYARIKGIKPQNEEKQVT